MGLFEVFSPSNPVETSTKPSILDGFMGTIEKVSGSLNKMLESIKHIFQPKLEVLKTDIETTYSINQLKDKTIKTATAGYEKLIGAETPHDWQQLALLNHYKGDKERFGKKVMEISSRLGINPNWIMAVMYKESRLNPKAINKNGGASGLIQFMPRTAKRLGTSVHQIRTMSAEQQLDYVEKYLKNYASKIHSYEDTYLAVFYPAYLGKGDDKKLPQKVIAQNPGVGTTVGEFTNHYAYRDIPRNEQEKIA